MLTLKGFTGGSTRDRTGSHTPRRAIPLARSSQTTALVGIVGRPDPTNPGSCHENSKMRVRWFDETDEQVVSHR